MSHPTDNPYQSPSVESAAEVREVALATVDVADAATLMTIRKNLTRFGMGLSVILFFYGAAVLFWARSDEDVGSMLVAGMIVGGTLTVFGLCWLTLHNSLAALTIVGATTAILGAAGCFAFAFAQLRPESTWFESAISLGYLVAVAYLAVFTPLRMLYLAWRFHAQGVSLAMVAERFAEQQLTAETNALGASQSRT